MYHKTIIALFLLITTIAGYAAAEALDKIVAVVNNEVITQQEVQDKVVLVKRQAAAAHQTLPADAELKKTILEQLINRALQLQVAKRAKIEVPDAELNSAIQDIAARNHLSLEQFKQSLARDGITFTDFRKQIQEEMLMSKVERQAVNPNVNITDEEVASFLKSGAGNEADKEYHVLDILVPVADQPTPKELQDARNLALATEKKLRVNANLAEIVRVNNLQQQDLAWRKLAELPSIFGANVSKMQSGEISIPIQAPNGFHIVKLLAVRQLPTTALTTDQAREILYHHKLDENLKTWLQELRKQSYIKVEEKF